MKIFIIAIIVLLTGCSSGEKEKTPESNVALGENVFNQNSSPNLISFTKKNQKDSADF